MNVAFGQASYLAQVRRLRALAHEALRLYATRIESCRFLAHGENATFHVTAAGRRQFLLRIHRNGYHSRSVSSADQRVISDGRRRVYRKLKRFEARFPQRQGLIHADLHFGNLLLSQGHIAAIDFDDCGFGFHAYDLVVPLRNAEYILGKRRRRELPRFKEALVEGYSRQCGWDNEDEGILPYMMIARGLALLGWLNSRSDNPSLRKNFKIVATRVVKQLKALD